MVTTGILISGKMSVGIDKIDVPPRKSNERGQYVERVWKFQSESYNAHDQNPTRDTETSIGG